MRGFLALASVLVPGCTSLDCSPISAPDCRDALVCCPTRGDKLVDDCFVQLASGCEGDRCYSECNGTDCEKALEVYVTTMCGGA